MSVRPTGLRYFIPGLLTQLPMSGYDIVRVLKSLGRLVSVPSFGSLYLALNSLAKDGLVTMELDIGQNKPSRKIYNTTQEGRQTLKEWINQPTGANAPVKAFLMRLLLADDLSEAGLITRLYQRRAQIAMHRAALDENARIADDRANKSQRTTLEPGLTLASAELAWLDSPLDRLSQQPQPMEVVQGDGPTKR